MRLSPAAELAVRGMLILAGEQDQGPIPLAAICERRELPRQYLTKIFASLAKAGLVTPVRGKNGGYLLGRPAEKISVLDVIEAVEGPVAMNYCQHDPPNCEQIGCPVRGVWSEIQKTVVDKLGSLSLADCVNCQAFGDGPPDATSE